MGTTAAGGDGDIRDNGLVRGARAGDAGLDAREVELILL
jgi:hypothetical protein